MNGIDEVAQIAPNRSSFQTTSVSPPRRAFRHAEMSGRSSRR
jgi:hypothetical protein